MPAKSLCHEEWIEGISLNGGKGFHCRSVPAGDREFTMMEQK